MSDRIAVTQLLHTVAFGGVETMILNWARAIDPGRFDMTLVCFANPGETHRPFVTAAAKMGFEVATIPWGRRKPLFEARRALARLLTERRTDILHTHNCYADCVGALTARILPIKTIATISVWADYHWKRRLIQLVNDIALRQVDQVTVHCEHTRRATIARGYAPESLTTLICGFETHPVSLSTEERLARRRSMDLADDAIVLVNLARLYPEKRQDALIRCFAEIRRRHPRAILWMIGVGPLEADLKALCATVGVQDSVRFLGWIEDLPSTLSLADIQVHSSTMEGVSLSIGEGMAAGLPVVGTDVGGMSEIVEHARTGLLVPLGDDQGFIDAVVRLIDAPDERRRFGDAGRHFITHDYSLTTAVTRLERAYTDLLADRG